MAEYFFGKWKRFFTAAAFLIIVILTGFFIGHNIEPSTGLSRRKGSLERYLSPETGIFLSLQRSGTDAWGFLEWPEKGLYGFFNGSGEGREIRAFIGSAGASPLMILSPASALGWLELRFSGGKDLGGSFRLIRQKKLPWGLETFSGRLDADESSFHAAIIRGVAEHEAALLNLALRRGMTQLEYVRRQWEAFRERRIALTQASRWPIEFMERQGIISATSSVYSIAVERYVFDGGAHGNTSLVVTMVDVGSGRILTAEDIFIAGWEEKVAPLLEAEALRLLAGTGRREELKQVSSLREYGFFEDHIEPSSNIFLCESGVGFHYDRYQLAPYSEGDYTFVIAWKDLEGILRSW